MDACDSSEILSLGSSWSPIFQRDLSQPSWSTWKQCLGSSQVQINNKSLLWRYPVFLGLMFKKDMLKSIHRTPKDINPEIRELLLLQEGVGGQNILNPTALCSTKSKGWILAGTFQFGCLRWFRYRLVNSPSLRVFPWHRSWKVRLVIHGVLKEMMAWPPKWMFCEDMFFRNKSWIWFALRKLQGVSG